MGLLSRKPKPAYLPPDLPLSHAPQHRRESVMDRIRNFSVASTAGPSSEADGSLHGTQQTSFLGRKFSQALGPAFARKASLAVAEKHREPTGLRFGETDGTAQAEFLDVFNGKLELDGTDDEQEKPKRMAIRAPVKDWTATLGWDAPPRGTTKRGKAREKLKRKHRNKRVMKELDADLEAFNTYAQNGLTPLTRSLNGSTMSLAEEEEVSDGGPRAVLIGDGFDALDIMADHIFRIGVQKKKWFRPPKMGQKREEVGTGVTLRVKTGLYRTFPVDYDALEEFEEAMTRLNPEVGIKIKSQIVDTIMRTYINASPSMSELIIDANTRIQILDEVEHLARARKHQYAAFIRSEEVLCVWADHVEAVIPAAEALEESLIQFIWRGEEENKKMNQAMVIDDVEKKDDESFYEDPEDSAMRKMKRHWRERPVMLWAPFSDGLSIILSMALISL